MDRRPELFTLLFGIWYNFISNGMVALIFSCVNRSGIRLPKSNLQRLQEETIAAGKRKEIAKDPCPKGYNVT